MQSAVLDADPVVVLPRRNQTGNDSSRYCRLHRAGIVAWRLSLRIDLRTSFLHQRGFRMVSAHHDQDIVPHRLRVPTLQDQRAFPDGSLGFIGIPLGTSRSEIKSIQLEALRYDSTHRFVTFVVSAAKG